MLRRSADDRASASPLRRGEVAGTVAAVSSGTVYGTIGVMIKLAYRSDASPTGLLAIRLSFGALIIWAVVLALRLPRRIPRDRLPAFVVMGALFGGTAAMFFVALTRIEASTAILLLYTQPALVAALAVSLRRERLTRLKFVSLVLAMAGVVLVVGAPDGHLDPLGVALALLAAVGLSVQVLVMQRAIVGLHPAAASGAVLGIAAALFVPIAAVTGRLQLDVPAGGVAWGFVIALVSSVGLILFMAGVDLVGPTRASIGATMEPVVTVVLATFVLGEHLAPVQLVGGLLVVAAVALLPFMDLSPVPEPHP